MASIYLIRHGQASFGSDIYDQLSPLGQRQADLVGQYFQQVGIRFDYAIAGDLSRQQETGRRVLASQAEPPSLNTDPRFDEVDNDSQVRILLPELVKRDDALRKLVDSGFESSKEYQKVIKATFTAWILEGHRYSGLQHWSEYRDGVSAALEGVMQAAGGGTNSAVFTSGGTIATAVGLVLKASAERFYDFYEPVFNCSITRLIFSGSRVSLSNFNDVAHLSLLSAQLSEDLVTYR
ncbi:phosphoglycerate mutase [Luminiphilus syltensis NOR5-1B]|uniref:Phosphoglycerate mutase n=1 Tax=Luminiphilus syltensis NOR5-1B TaxID=565045 RepID=B8KWV5_9GAMM|nr:histidine phosphatase family protein [Luminiphilus syltensis]EED34557.1 phosphoglycerate mutase [Luminiphilus syltensis NOR5-1B]